MTTLVACLSTGKGSWAEVTRLIRQASWEKVILVTNEFGKEKFILPERGEFVLINPDENPVALAEHIRKGLSGRITGTEVALNFTSGSGNEHQAMLAAVLKLGFGVRLVVPGERDVVEL
jgi:hypothetical protein